MLKKVTTIVMTLILLLSLSSSAMAKVLNSKDIDNELRKLKIPEELIMNMSSTQKEDIVNNVVEFGSFKTVYMKATEGGMMPAATIPGSDLSLTVFTGKLADSADGRERYNVYVNYNWLVMPTYKQTDPYGVSWDGNKWRPVQGSYYNEDNSRIQKTGVWFHEYDTALAYASFTGAGWNAVWPNTFLYGDIDRFEGYGKLSIESQTPGQISGNDLLYFNYSHTYGFTGTIGLKLGILSISYSGTKSADTRGDVTLFNY